MWSYAPLLGDAGPQATQKDNVERSPPSLCTWTPQRTSNTFRPSGALPRSALWSSCAGATMETTRILQTTVSGFPLLEPWNQNGGPLCGWLPKLWSLFWVLVIIRHLLFREPKKGTMILTTTHVYVVFGPKLGKPILDHPKALLMRS